MNNLPEVQVPVIEAGDLIILDLGYTWIARENSRRSQDEFRAYHARAQTVKVLHMHVGRTQELYLTDEMYMKIWVTVSCKA